jgi:hypothetical protein
VDLSGMSAAVYKTIAYSAATGDFGNNVGTPGHSLLTAFRADATLDNDNRSKLGADDLLVAAGTTLTIDSYFGNVNNIINEGTVILTANANVQSSVTILNYGTVVNDGTMSGTVTNKTNGARVYSYDAIPGVTTLEPLNLALVFAQNGASAGSFNAIINDVNDVNHVSSHSALQTTSTSDPFSTSWPCVASYLYKKADGTCVGFRQFVDNPLPRSCVRRAGSQSDESIGYNNGALVFGSTSSSGGEPDSYAVSDGAKIVVVIYDSAGGSILDAIDAALPDGNKLTNKTTSLPYSTGGSMQGAMAAFDKTQLSALVNEMSGRSYNFRLRGAQNAAGQLTAAILDFVP